MPQDSALNKKDELLSKVSDQWWRLNNLYHIRDKEGKDVLFKPNWAQTDLYNNRHFFNVILKARQLGFSTFILIYLLDSCLFTDNHSAGVIAHTREDSEDLFKNKVKYAYDSLPDWVKGTFTATQDSSRRLEFSNGSSITVGTSLRGGTFQKLHISEYGKIAARYPEKAKEIKTGALNTVHVGQQIFVESTAEGSSGEFYDLCMNAMRLKERGLDLTELDPKIHFYPWFKNFDYVLNSGKNNITIDQTMCDYFDRIESEANFKLNSGQKCWYVKKKEQQGEDIKREFPSTPQEAFEQSMEGAYYTKQMSIVRKSGGIGSFPWVPDVPVFTFWDLGMNDSTSIWFMQHLNNKFRFIDYLEASGEGLQYYANELIKKGYVYARHYWPHDGNIRDLSTGLQRRQTAQSLGIFPIEVLPRTKSVNDGIHSVRNTLPLCEFNEETCSEGIKHLDNYRKEWDDRMGVWKDRPRHDDASHGADSFRAFAVGYKEKRSEFQFDSLSNFNEGPKEAEDFNYDLFSV